MKYIVLFEGTDNQLYLLLNPENRNITGFDTKEDLVKGLMKYEDNIRALEEKDAIIVEFPGPATDLKGYLFSDTAGEIPLGIPALAFGPVIDRSILDFLHSSLRDEYTKHLQSLINQ